MKEVLLKIAGRVSKAATDESEAFFSVISNETVKRISIWSGKSGVRKNCLSFVQTSLPASIVKAFQSLELRSTKGSFPVFVPALVRILPIMMGPWVRTLTLFLTIFSISSCGSGTRSSPAVGVSPRDWAKSNLEGTRNRGG